MPRQLNKDGNDANVFAVAVLAALFCLAQDVSKVLALLGYCIHTRDSARLNQ
jgi:uncharacterized membrane protein